MTKNIENSNLINFPVKGVDISSPSDIKIMNDKVYIVDELNHRIVVLSKDGDFLTSIGKEGTGVGELRYPKTIAVLQNGDMYVTDSWNHRILMFSPEGRVKASFGRYGNELGALNEPFGIVVIKDLIFVVERGNHRISVFSPKGESYGFFGELGIIKEEMKSKLLDIDEFNASSNTFFYPTNIISGTDDEIFIVDSGNHRVKRYRSNGDYLSSFGTRGIGEAQFQYPYSICMDENKNMFVSDFNNNRIQRLTYGGSFVSSYFGFECPSALFVSDSSLLFSTSFKKDISKVEYDNKTVKPVVYSICDLKDANSKLIDESDLVYELFVDLTKNKISFDKVSLDNIFLSFNKNEDKIGGNLFNGKDKLLLILNDLVSKGLELEKDRISKKPLNVKLERERSRLETSYQNLLDEQNENFLRLKCLTEKRYEVIITVLEKSDQFESYKDIVIRDTGSSFEKTCYTLDKLMAERESHITEAKKCFVKNGKSDEENWLNFKISYDKASLIKRFIDLFLISSKVSFNKFLVVSGSLNLNDLKMFSFSKPLNSLFEKISGILYHYNDDWSYLTSLQYIRVEPKTNVEFELLSFLRTGFLLEKTVDSFFDKELLLDADKLSQGFLDDDFIKRQLLFSVKGADTHCDKLFSMLDVFGLKDFKDLDKYININLDSVRDIKNILSQKDSESETVLKELFKLEITLEYGSNDFNNSVLMCRKLDLLRFNYMVLKKDVLKASHIYKILIYYINLLYILKVKSCNGKSAEVDSLIGKHNQLKSDTENTLFSHDLKFKELFKKKCELTNTENFSGSQQVLENEYNLKDIDSKLLKLNFCIIKLDELVKLNLLFNSFMKKSVSLKKDKRTFNRYAGNKRALNGPSAVAFDSSGDIYITEFTKHRVKKISSDGKFLFNFSSFGIMPGNLKAPAGIAIDNEDIIYVTSSYNHRIEKFSTDGEFIGSFGTFGEKDGELNIPYRIFVDKNRFLYVTEFGNNRVSKFDFSGNFLMSFGSSGTENGNFINPSDILVLDDGKILISELGNSRLQLFDSNGVFLKVIGCYGAAKGEFCDPSGLSIDSKGNIYVSEFSNSRIQILSPDFKFLSFYGRHGDDMYDFYGLNYIQISGDKIIALDLISEDILTLKL